jgi:hypothetical protein
MYQPTVVSLVQYNNYLKILIKTNSLDKFFDLEIIGNQVPLVMGAIHYSEIDIKKLRPTGCASFRIKTFNGK